MSPMLEKSEEEEVVVLIVGAGPAGLATAACLARRGVHYAVVEREACSASLWRERAYDRLKLHLAKEFCELPHMAYPPGTPTYVPKDKFVGYLDGYAERFGIRPRFRTAVESAAYDEGRARWAVSARDLDTGAAVTYAARFVVVATGENSAPNIPRSSIAGLDGFAGEVVHSSAFKSGRFYAGKNVLVVGAGNSGMEIAYDLASHGANTSIVVRSPVHIMNKELIRIGMTLVQHLPVTTVDALLVTVANLVFGDMSRYGIVRPKMGPLLLKAQTGRSAVIDVGTARLIKEEVIKVFRGISNINGNIIEFYGGKRCHFDAIVFSTGYKSTVNTWLKNGEDMFTEDGFPKKDYPNQWKGGNNGLYSAGFAKRGLAGIAMDAKNIANDIVTTMNKRSG